MVKFEVSFCYEQTIEFFLILATPARTIKKTCLKLSAEIIESGIGICIQVFLIPALTVCSAIRFKCYFLEYGRPEDSCDILEDMCFLDELRA